MLRRTMWVCVTMVALALPGAASAQSTLSSGVGPRIGFSSDPDQLLVGGQLTMGPVAPNLTFDPSLELGFGDDLTIIAVNLDLHYHFDTKTTWRPYVGAGATINWVDFDNDTFGDRDSDTRAGGGLIIGAGVPTASGSRFFAELKAGLSSDVPDLKIVAGWNFKI